MTAGTSADEQLVLEPRAIPRIVAGALILIAALWAAARIAYWYVSDNMVSGVYLRDPSAVRLPAFAAALVVACGITVLVMRRRFRGTTGLLALAALTAVCVVGAWLAVASYPAIQRSRVTAIAPGSNAVLWTTTVPLTVVNGVTDDNGDRVTVTGTFMDHGCQSSYRAVTLDRDTGEVVDVVDLPGSYPTATGPVGGGEPLPGHGLVADRGTLPFVCLN